MNSIYLVYAGPPLLGAFIGYLTNKIAIRMLFRPLKRWRILGIRVPMTPGVIPGKRHELAKNIGEMVGRHLLTSRDIGSALSEERFQVHLNSLVEERVNDLLNRELGRLPDVIPERFRAYFKVAVGTLKYQFRATAGQYLQSSEFEARVADTVMDQLNSFGDKHLNELISSEERQAFYGFIDKLVENILAGREAEDWLTDYLRKYFEQSAAQGKSIGDHLPEPLYNLILDVIRQYSPDILKQLSRIMAEPEVRERIIGIVRGGIDDFIGSLGRIGAMAGNFMNMNALEQKIREYLVNNDDKIVSWLQNPEVQERFSTVLVEQTRKFLDTPLADILDKAEEGQLDAICREVSVQVFAALQAPGVKGAMSTVLRENLEEMLGRGELSVAAISNRLLDARTVKSLKVTITEEAVALLRTRRVLNMVDRVLYSMADSLLSRPIGILNNILPSGIRTGMIEYAVLTINRILLREVPSLVEHLNVERIVTEKVDSLDLLKLEGLLLSIMQEQFKYINLFGALLGFLIGLANLLVMRIAG
ncbi:MAG: DUF445 family protein [Desulfobulbaceae bacterium]|nr:DUF445 family protein [Desulfobulbaceae bacterium]